MYSLKLSIELIIQQVMYNMRGCKLLTNVDSKKYVDKKFFW